jgi:multidrug resistance efflux pump
VRESLETALRRAATAEDRLTVSGVSAVGRIEELKRERDTAQQLNWELAAQLRVARAAWAATTRREEDRRESRAEAEAQLDTIFGQLRAWMIRMARMIDG